MHNVRENRDENVSKREIYLNDTRLIFMRHQCMVHLSQPVPIYCKKICLQTCTNLLSRKWTGQKEESRGGLWLGIYYSAEGSRSQKIDRGACRYYASLDASSVYNAQTSQKIFLRHLRFVYYPQEIPMWFRWIFAWFYRDFKLLKWFPSDFER